jgi:hypothetical protein
MALRLLLTLAVLLTGACTTNDPNKKASLDEVERRHAEDTLRGGGGGGGGGSGM